MGSITPHNISIVYSSQTSSSGGGGNKSDPKAPPGSTDPRDDPRPEELNGDWLTLSQEPYAEAPAGGFNKWLQDNDKDLTVANQAEYLELYGSKCEEGGNLKVNIRVSKSRNALQYKLIASYGTLSPVSVGETDEKKSVTVEAGEETDLQTHVKGNVTATWEGPVYDENGTQLAKAPTINQEGSKLSWDGKATGTLRVEYTQSFDVYTLDIIPRAEGDYSADDRSKAYETTVMAFWGDGNVVTMAVDLPDMNGNCATKKVKSGDDEEEEDDETAGCYDLYIKYHKCTGEEISRELKAVPCPEDLVEE